MQASKNQKNMENHIYYKMGKNNKQTKNKTKKKNNRGQVDEEVGEYER